MALRIQIDATFPSGHKRAFRSVSACARVLSGNGKAPSRLREAIEIRAFYGLMPTAAPAGDKKANEYRGVKLYG